MVLVHNIVKNKWNIVFSSIRNLHLSILLNYFRFKKMICSNNSIVTTEQFVIVFLLSSGILYKVDISISPSLVLNGKCFKH